MMASTQSTRALSRDGKPMRALHVLAAATRPLYEDEVWRRARRDAFDTTMWFSALKTLVDRGYAARSGARGGYRYEITDAGREALR